MVEKEVLWGSRSGAEHLPSTHKALGLSASTEIQTSKPSKTTRRQVRIICSVMHFIPLWKVSLTQPMCLVSRILKWKGHHEDTWKCKRLMTGRLERSPSHSWDKDTTSMWKSGISQHQIRAPENQLTSDKWLRTKHGKGHGRNGVSVLRQDAQAKLACHSAATALSYPYKPKYSYSGTQPLHTQVFTHSSINHCAHLTPKCPLAGDA